MNQNTYTLSSDMRLETILLSLTDENYKPLIDQLKNSLKDYDKDLIAKLDKYIWLTETQLQNHVPNKQTLKTEFTELLLDDYQPITDMDELTDYIHIFISQKTQRFISGQLSQIADTVRSQGLNDKLIEQIYKYTAIAEVDSDYVSIGDVFTELYQKQVKMQGVSFLCSELDHITGGIMPGSVCTIMGATGSMKTTYASNIAYNAVKEGKNVLFLSLEESPMQLYSKWLSRASMDAGKPLLREEISQKKLDEKDEKILIEQVVPYFQQLPGKLYIVGEQDLKSYQLTSIEAKFKEIDRKAKAETGKGIDIIVVDHIQLLKFAQQGLSEFTVINMYMSFFRQQSLSWLHEKREVIFIVLSQANREGYAYAQRHDGMYLSQHLAEASEVERASTYIISVYTENMMQLSKQLKLGAVKLRNAALPPSTILVYTEGEYYQVGDTSVPEQADYSSTDLFDSGDQSTTASDLTMDDMLMNDLFTSI